jgi:hypothetical protein
MSKRNAALEALTKAPVPSPSNVVELKANDPAPAPAAPPVEAASPKTATPPSGPRASGRKTVANSAARAMLYLPPKAKRKFKEIAFHENRKEHDIYMEALREYLERKGHKGLL